MGSVYERAEIYDLLENKERTEIIRNDWKEFLGRRKIKTMLDVSIGTGSMTLPLQELNIEIYGSDLSREMLSRCREKAMKKNRPVRLECCDFRDLSCWGDLMFDCVASTGNALGYVSNKDVLKTVEEMDAHIRPGGYFCFDSRNWEKIQREKQRFYLYNPFFHNGTRVNLVQVWDHNIDGTITFNLLYTFERENRLRKRSLKRSIIPFPLEWLRKSLMTLVTVRSVSGLFPAAFLNGILTGSNGTGSLPGNRKKEAYSSGIQ